MRRLCCLPADPASHFQAFLQNHLSFSEIFSFVLKLLLLLLNEGYWKQHIFLITLLLSLFSSRCVFLDQSVFSCQSFCHIEAGGCKLTSRRMVSPEIFHIRENIVAFMACRGQYFQQTLLFPLNSCKQMACRTEEWLKSLDVKWHLQQSRRENVCQFFLDFPHLLCHSSCTEQMRRGLIVSWLMVKSELLLFKDQNQEHVLPQKSSVCSTGGFHLKY